MEAGRDIFPDEWLDQISALLKQNDPLEFIEKMRGLYETEAHSANDAESSDEQAVNADSSVDQRRRKLQGIFSDEQLENLTDSQFEELLVFVETNCQAALQLVLKK